MGDRSENWSVAGELWRTMLVLWLAVMVAMFGVALVIAQGTPPVFQAFGYALPLLTAVVALRGVRETMRQKQESDDHAHWWDQAKWAFDVVMNPGAQVEDLEMTVETLVDQVEVGDVPGADLRKAARMLDRATGRLETLGDTSTSGTVRGDDHG